LPSGIFKSVQVAGGVALPASASISIERSKSTKTSTWMNAKGREA
jgi:hypothetical protein